MTPHGFRILHRTLQTLTRTQTKTLIRQLKEKLSSEQSVELIESSFEQQQRCPHCQNAQIVRWGSANSLQRYRCKTCRKTFNALTKTPLARLRHKTQWLTYSNCLNNGDSVRLAARRCAVNPTTSFRWRHRFLTRPTSNKAARMTGIVEADETFFTESCKGNKALSHRSARKRGRSDKRSLKGRIPVLIVRDRNGAVADFVFQQIEKEKMHACLKPLMCSKDVVLCTDGNNLYRSFAENENIAHKRIIALDKVHVIDKIFHIQNLNAYISRLKQWMTRFNGVSTKHLPNYLGWRRLLEKQCGETHAEFCLRQALA